MNIKDLIKNQHFDYAFREMLQKTEKYSDWYFEIIMQMSRYNGTNRLFLDKKISEKQAQQIFSEIEKDTLLILTLLETQNRKAKNNAELIGSHNTVIQGSKIKFGNSEWLIAFIITVFLLSILFGIKMFLDSQNTTEKTQIPQNQELTKPTKDTIFIKPTPEKTPQTQKNSQKQTLLPQTESYFTVTLKNEEGTILDTKKVKKGAGLQKFGVEGYKTQSLEIEEDTEITLEKQ